MSEKFTHVPQEHWKLLGIPTEAERYVSQIASKTFPDSAHPRALQRMRAELVRQYQETAESYEAHLGIFNDVFQAQLLKELGVPPLSAVDHVVPNEIRKKEYSEREQRVRTEEGNSRRITDEDVLSGIRADIKNQSETLTDWFYYLRSPEASYPDWFKIYALKSISQYTKFDTNLGEKGKFKPRDGKILADFPSCNARALSELYTALEKPVRAASETDEVYAEKVKAHKQKIPSFSFIQEYERLFQKYGTLNLNTVRGLPLEAEPVVFKRTASRFSKVRGALMRIPSVRGILPQSNADKLVHFLTSAGSSSEPFNVEWCIAGIGHAERYLSDGDVHIFYSKKDDAHFPRVAVVFDELGNVKEVRGIARRQELEDDEGLSGEVEEILRKLSGGFDWARRAKNVKRINTLHKKVLKAEELSPDDIQFVYAQQGPVDGLGYGERHPLVDVIRAKRSEKGKFVDDMCTALSVRRDEIAFNSETPTARTKVYIGGLHAGVLQGFRRGMRVFGSFPDEEIKLTTLRRGTDYTGGPEQLDILPVSIEQLGLSWENASYSALEVIQHAKKLGLTYPPDVRLKNSDEVLKMKSAYWPVAKMSQARAAREHIINSYRKKPLPDKVSPQFTLSGYLKYSKFFLSFEKE